MPHPPSRFLWRQPSGWVVACLLSFWSTKEGTVHTFRMLVLVAALGSGACAQDAGTLAGATRALGATDLKSIEYSGNGKWFQFGQAPSPTLPWPAVRRQQLHGERSTTTTPAARVQMTRIQVVEPGARRAPRQWSSARCRSSAAPTRGTWRRRPAPRRTRARAAAAARSR